MKTLYRLLILSILMIGFTGIGQEVTDPACNSITSEQSVVDYTEVTYSLDENLVAEYDQEAVYDFVIDDLPKSDFTPMLMGSDLELGTVFTTADGPSIILSSNMYSYELVSITIESYNAMVDRIRSLENEISELQKALFIINDKEDRRARDGLTRL